MVVLLSIVAPAPGALGATTGDVWLEESFEGPVDEWSVGWVGTSSVRNRVRPGPGVDGGGIEVVIPEGEHFGSEMRWRFASNGVAQPDAAWFRYWLRIDADGPVGSGKIPGLAGLYSRSGRGNVPPTDVAPGWSARLQFWGLHPSDKVEMGSYVYHLDQANTFGDGLPWSEEVTVGEWVCVEGHVAMNTPGEADGVEVGWLNGAEVHREEGFRFRGAEQERVAIESFWLAIYHGGAEPAAVEHRFGVDELVVADHRVGCGSDPVWGFNDLPPGPFGYAATRLEALGILSTCEVTGRKFCPGGTFGTQGLADILERASLDDGRTPEELAFVLAEELGSTPASAPKERVVLALDGILAAVPAPWEETFDEVVAPGEDLQAALGRAGVGGRVLVESGAHEVDSLTPLEGQSLIGEPGALLVPAGGAPVGIAGSQVPGVVIAGIEVMGFEVGIESGEGWLLDHVGLTSNQAVGTRVGGNIDLVDLVAWGNGVHVDVPRFALVRMSGGTLSSVNAADRIPVADAWGIRVSAPAMVAIEDVRFAGGAGGAVGVTGGGTVSLRRVVALDLDGPVVHAERARAVAIVNSILQGNGVPLGAPAVVIDAPVVIVASTTFRANHGGVVLRPSAPGVLGAVVDNRFSNTGPSGLVAHPWSTAALVEWDRNSYSSEGALRFLVAEEEVGPGVWQLLPLDATSSIGGG